MEEEDLDAVAEAWGGEDEDLIPGAPTEGLDKDMEGFEDAAANGEEDEEGGWDMEVFSRHLKLDLSTLRMFCCSTDASMPNHVLLLSQQSCWLYMH